MVTPPLSSSRRVLRQRGFSMLEVLITIVVVSLGLLGMAGLQARVQVSEVESYQRAQALVLLTDMVNRIATNRTVAGTYVTGSTSPLGAGMICPTATTTLQQNDFVEWCNALQGAAETSGGNKLGAVIGGRGCVDGLSNGEYMVTVAWQGLTPISTPGSGVTCGANAYNTTGSMCVSDLCRRTVTTVVRIAPLM